MAVYSIAMQVFRPTPSAWTDGRPARLDDARLLQGDLSGVSVQRIADTTLPQLGAHLCGATAVRPNSLLAILQREIRMGLRHLTLPSDESEPSAQQSLQQLIRHCPEDGDHWSVYADWLADRELVQPFLAGAFQRAAHQIQMLSPNEPAWSVRWVEVELSPHCFTAHCAAPVATLGEPAADQAATPITGEGAMSPSSPSAPEKLCLTWWSLLDDVWTQQHPQLEAALEAHDTPAT